MMKGIGTFGVSWICQEYGREDPFLERIKNFFVNVLLGVTTFLLTNVEKIMSQETLVEKFKEFKESLMMVMILNKNLFQPIMDVQKLLLVLLPLSLKFWCS